MKRSRNSFAIPLALLMLAAVVCGQDAPPAPKATASRELNMLVLGDSIMWGQGLREEHKSWFLVKSWLEQSGVMVHAKIEAHAARRSRA